MFFFSCKWYVNLFAIYTYSKYLYLSLFFIHWTKIRNGITQLSQETNKISTLAIGITFLLHSRNVVPSVRKENKKCKSFKKIDYKYFTFFPSLMQIKIIVKKNIIFGSICIIFYTCYNKKHQISKSGIRNEYKKKKWKLIFLWNINSK